MEEGLGVGDGVGEGLGVGVGVAVVDEVMVSYWYPST